MIGYYVHHHGGGHAQRAAAVARHLRHPVTGLSSAPRPEGWTGEWLELPRDDRGHAPVDVDAGGHLHWVPEHDDGLRSRTAAISGWIERHRPRLMMVDVSVEVVLLARLHGVPVVSMVLPGDRRDTAHALAHGVARRLVAAWPPEARGMTLGLDADDPRLVCVGAVSRYDDLAGAARTPGRGRAPHVVVLMGAGGTDLTAEALETARSSTPRWRWTVLDAALGSWTRDPWSILRDADVVVTHAGQNALAEVAAARTPAVVVPQHRPHDEQVVTARALEGGRWPVVVEGSFGHADWPAVLERARGLPGQAWQTWNDGGGARRMARLLDAEADPVAVPA